jgi:hypothetical protein
MDGAERATADLIVYGVLIDPVVRPAVVVVAGELDSSVESFLDFAVSAWCALVLSGGAHEAGSATVVRTASQRESRTSQLVYMRSLNKMQLPIHWEGSIELGSRACLTEVLYCGLARCRGPGR